MFSDRLIGTGLPRKIRSRKGTEAGYVDEVNRQVEGIDGCRTVAGVTILTGEQVSQAPCPFTWEHPIRRLTDEDLQEPWS